MPVMHPCKSMLWREDISKDIPVLMLNSVSSRKKIQNSVVFAEGSRLLHYCYLHFCLVKQMKDFQHRKGGKVVNKKKICWECHFFLVSFKGYDGGS